MRWNFYMILSIKVCMNIHLYEICSRYIEITSSLQVLRTEKQNQLI